LQYKPDAQARDREILGNIPSLARRACICATSKHALRACRSGFEPCRQFSARLATMRFTVSETMPLPAIGFDRAEIQDDGNESKLSDEFRVEWGRG
jgi:hypothetical protein